MNEEDLVWHIVYKENLPEGFHLADGLTWYTDSTTTDFTTNPVTVKVSSDMKCVNTEGDECTLEKWEKTDVGNTRLIRFRYNGFVSRNPFNIELKDYGAYMIGYNGGKHVFEGIDLSSVDYLVQDEHVTGFYLISKTQNIREAYKAYDHTKGWTLTPEQAKAELASFTSGYLTLGCCYGDEESDLTISSINIDNRTLESFYNNFSDGENFSPKGIIIKVTKVDGTEEYVTCEDETNPPFMISIDDGATWLNNIDHTFATGDDIKIKIKYKGV